MRKGNLNIRQIFLTLLVSGLGSVLIAKGDGAAVVSYQALTEARLDTLIVARVGDIAITAKEFLLSYEYGPAFVKRGKEAPRRYLEFMINEKLLALEGHSQGLQHTAQVRETLAQMEGDLATEELFKDEVMSKVQVTEAEIETAVAREKVQISLQWLFVRSTDEAKRLHKQLRRGASFDSLFALQLNDSVTVEDRSWETTPFRLASKNPALSQIVDTLAFGRVSGPISAPDGWYLVKIADDSWTNIVTTETEENKLRHELHRALFKRKMDALSDQYVQSMMQEEDPVIVRKTFDLLRADLGERILSPEKFSQWNLKGRLLEEYGPVNLADIKTHGDMPLVKLHRGVVELKHFLTWYRTRETTIRLKTDSPEDFFVSLQQMVWRMTRDYLLVQRAYQRVLQHRESVRTQIQWWEEKIIYAVMKSALSQSLDIADSLLEAYYRDNIRHYRNGSGETVAFEKAKNDVRRDYYAQEINRKLLQRILKLKEQYGVEIYAGVLDRLSGYYPINRDAKAIDIYVIKKGGTFPRPAFPTIDYEWKTWY